VSHQDSSCTRRGRLVAALRPCLTLVMLLPGCTCVSRDATGDPGALGGFEQDVLYELQEPVLLFYRKDPETVNMPRYALVPPLTANADQHQLHDFESYTQGSVAIATIPPGTRLRIAAVRLYACPDFKETVLYGKLAEGPHKDKLVALNTLSTPIIDHVTDVTARNPDARYLRLADAPPRHE
jgi:hypothetical protein